MRYVVSDPECQNAWQHGSASQDDPDTKRECHFVFDVQRSEVIAMQILRNSQWEIASADEAESLEDSLLFGDHDALDDPETHGLRTSSDVPDWAEKAKIGTEAAGYVATDPEGGTTWSHIFDEDGDEIRRECHFVFDCASNEVIAMRIQRDHGWDDASRSEIEDLEESLKDANHEALEQPHSWGLRRLVAAPEWAAEPLTCGADAEPEM